MNTPTLYNSLDRVTMERTLFRSLSMDSSPCLESMSPALLEPLYPMPSSIDQFQQLWLHDQLQLQQTQIQKLATKLNPEPLKQDTICPRDLTCPITVNPQMLSSPFVTEEWLTNLATDQLEQPVSKQDEQEEQEGEHGEERADERRAKRSSTTSSTSSIGQRKPSGMSDKEWKRKIKNRESAKRSRVRKVAHFEQLELDHAALQQKHAELVAQLEQFQKHCTCHFRHH